MSIIVNPYSELLREPNLLIPGRKPIGKVKIDWSHPHTKGLIYWWPMLELYGTMTRDMVNGTEATFVNTPEWSMPHPNEPSGLICTKTDADYLSVANYDPTSEGTVIMWVKPYQDIDMRFFGFHDAFEIRLLQTDKIISNQLCQAASPDTDSADNSWDVNVWVHIACTWNLTTNAGAIYVNGLESGTSSNANDDPGSGTLGIGARFGHSDYLDGQIDNVSISNKVLDAAIIRSIYLDEYAALIPA